MSSTQTVRDFNGNKVDHVLVSEGTRAMARPAGESRTRQQAELASLEQTVQSNTARKKQIETKLAVMNGRVRSHGQLPREEYRSIVAEQAALKRELGELEVSLAKDRATLCKLRDVQWESQKSGGKPELAPILNSILQELRAIRVMLAADRSS